MIAAQEKHISRKLNHDLRMMTAYICSLLEAYYSFRMELSMPLLLLTIINKRRRIRNGARYPLHLQIRECNLMTICTDMSLVA
jgi:hypothetical protein